MYLVSIDVSVGLSIGHRRRSQLCSKHRGRPRLISSKTGECTVEGGSHSCRADHVQGNLLVHTAVMVTVGISVAATSHSARSKGTSPVVPLSDTLEGISLARRQHCPVPNSLGTPMATQSLACVAVIVDGVAQWHVEERGLSPRLTSKWMAKGLDLDVPCHHTRVRPSTLVG